MKGRIVRGKGGGKAKGKVRWKKETQVKGRRLERRKRSKK